jgi:formylglycine-generating enzyme required for sulfatase activity
MVSDVMNRVFVLTLFGVAGCQGIAGIQDLPGPTGSSATTTTGAPTPDGGNDANAGATTARCEAVCGADGATDCCDAPLIPGGEFYRSYDAIDFTDSSSRATVNSFRLDRFEVTLGRFRRFVDAYQAGFRPASGAGNDPSNPNDGGWQSSFTAQLPADGLDLQANLECHSTFQTYRRTLGTTEERPINCVTWFVANAFCIWDGGRLPTDTEWNFAAAGGEEQRYYPWNDAIDPSRSSYFVDSQRQCFGDLVAGCAVSDLTPVGTHAGGAGKWGHMDLAGNVAEWTADWVPGTDDQGGGRRIRGGAFNSGAPGPLRVAAADTADPTSPSETIGFRCVRTP